MRIQYRPNSGGAALFKKADIDFGQYIPDMQKLQGQIQNNMPGWASEIHNPRQPQPVNNAPSMSLSDRLISAAGIDPNGTAGTVASLASYSIPGVGTALGVADAAQSGLNMFKANQRFSDRVSHFGSVLASLGIAGAGLIGLGGKAKLLKGLAGRFANKGFVSGMKAIKPAFKAGRLKQNGIQAAKKLQATGASQALYNPRSNSSILNYVNGSTGWQQRLRIANGQTRANMAGKGIFGKAIGNSLRLGRSMISSPITTGIGLSVGAPIMATVSDQRNQAKAFETQQRLMQSYASQQNQRYGGNQYYNKPQQRSIYGAYTPYKVNDYTQHPY